MHVSFRATAIAAAFLFFTLSAIFLLAPDLMLSLWSVAASDSAMFVARRAAMVYFGFGVLMTSARKLAPSPARTAIVRGLLAALIALAILGTIEFALGHAGAGVFAAVTVEIAFAAAFLIAEREAPAI